MKKQIFFILAVFFMLAAVYPAGAADAITNGDFEADPGITGWTPHRTCPNTSPPGVSIQLNNDALPALGDSTKVAVYYGKIASNSCKEIDAYLLQRITVPDNATLRFYYKIDQPYFTEGLAKADFRVKLKDLNGNWVNEELLKISQPSVSNPSYNDPIIQAWTLSETDLTAYAGNTYDFLFQFGVTEETSKIGYEIYFMLDNISFQIGSPDPVPGDIYNNDGVNLTDAIISLQITAGINPSGAINLNNDVDGNSIIGLENPIYILQDVAGLRATE